MSKIHEGKLDATGKKAAIVASRFNDFVTKRLVEGAIDCFLRHGMKEGSIDVFWVPGSFEIGQVVSRVGAGKKFAGDLCLGTMVRGETPHFDILSATVIRSIDRAADRLPVPVTFGLVTAESLEQAIDRAGAKHGNKGWHSALALIEMMRLWETVS
ncbi:MAG: 6,7-dimethyl-8-ribityllumazine synthase [Chitinivibrionia bacterium]|nr:6,7-dimethyl-8-ribityllumazine synthase [Chitinivibrionia bacterium]